MYGKCVCRVPQYYENTAPSTYAPSGCQWLGQSNRQREDEAKSWPTPVDAIEMH